jgi:phage I-like protein
MLAYFSRHEVDKKGSTWDEQGKGWQAWQGWGGDPGFSWARKLVRQMNAADKEQLNERVRAFSEATPFDLDGLTVVIEDGQRLGRPFVTLAAGKVSSRMSGELITEVTPEHLAELKRVFDSRGGSDPVIIDWNHQSSPNAGLNTPETGGALGEVVALRLSDDGRQLIAVPAYNARGLEVVEAAGGTLWSSPEFILGEVFARESGECTGGAQLLAITLTPRPQQTASSVGRVTLSEGSMDLENLEGLETEQLISMLRQKDALVKELEGRLKAQSMAEEDEQEELAEVSDEEKLAEDEEKKKMGEYRNLTERLTADNSQQAATINQLSEQVARLEKAERNARMTAELDQLTHSGRISPNERAYAENFWLLREKGEGLPWEMLTRREPNQVVNLSEVGHGASGEQLNRDSLTDRVKELAKSESIQFTEAWGRLQREEPQLFNAVFGG